MIIFGDYHTHTPYSHGKGTVLENVTVAKQKGLKEIAITDHGYGHKLFGVKRERFRDLVKECKKAQEKTGVRVLVGMEANLISNDGTIDLAKKELEMLDVVLVGHHNFVKAKTVADQFSLFVRNIISKIFPVSKNKIEKNTQAYLNMLKKYPQIDVITHLNYGMKVNTMKVALAAKENDVLIELNGKRILFTDQEMVNMANAGVKFIINSDAHSKNAVAEVNNAINLITRLNIPRELIVNLDKTPIFKKDKREN